MTVRRLGAAGNGLHGLGNDFVPVLWLVMRR
jgi:hypothetical protein